MELRAGRGVICRPPPSVKGLPCALLDGLPPAESVAFTGWKAYPLPSGALRNPWRSQDGRLTPCHLERSRPMGPADVLTCTCRSGIRRGFARHTLTGAHFTARPPNGCQGRRRPLMHAPHIQEGLADPRKVFFSTRGFKLGGMALGCERAYMVQFTFRGSPLFAARSLCIGTPRVL